LAIAAVAQAATVVRRRVRARPRRRIGDLLWGGSGAPHEAAENAPEISRLLARSVGKRFEDLRGKVEGEFVTEARASAAVSWSRGERP
jgi:hypothetical protein